MAATRTHATLQLLRRLLGPPPRAEGPYAGVPVVLDGITAMAITEASLGATSALAADGMAAAGRGEQARQGLNPASVPPTVRPAEDLRSALATATGLALAGARASVLLSAPELAAGLDLLTTAVGRHLPLVVHVINRALATHAATLGSGHEILHLAADTGCFILVAANAQQAADLTLIARHVAEQTLIPGLVVIDGEETALALQEVRLAPPELVRQMLGRPDDEIPSPTPAQALIFGDMRRRVPRWHDPERPVMLGGLESGAAWSLGSAAQQAYFASFLAACLTDACARFEQYTGRRYGPVSTHAVEDSPLLLVAAGSAIETAEYVANGLRDTLPVGVLGLQALRPWPRAEIVRLLGQGQRVCVLERLDVPLDGDPPLLREIRATLGWALDDGLHPGVAAPPGDRARTPLDERPALSESRIPRLLSVIYGLGGAPLRAADLAELCRQAGRIEQSRVYLGLRFDAASRYPKRQVLLDRLRRAYPDLAGLGLTAPSERASAPDLTKPQGSTPGWQPKSALGIAVHRISGQAGEGLLADLATLLHPILKGAVRGRPAWPTEPWGALLTDRLTLAAAPLRDPGADTPIDLALVTAPPGAGGLDPLAGLCPDGAVLFASPLPGEALWQALPHAMQQALSSGSGRLYHLPLTAAGGNELLLGGLCAVLIGQGLLDSNLRRLTSVREALLKQRVADTAPLLEAFRQGFEAVQPLSVPLVAAEPGQKALAPEAEQTPALLRELGAAGDGYDSLPRFWAQAGVLQHQGANAEWTPDPYLALGLLPPLSAGFRDLSTLRTQMPVWNPALCTSCGTCLGVCPDAAIGLRLFTPRSLLDDGVRQGAAEALGPVIGRLAKQMAQRCAATDTPAPASAGELFQEAWQRLETQTPLPAERTETLRAAASRWVAALGALPVAATASFFHHAEQARPGAGELLALAVNPAACKSCGLCVAHCPSGALRGSPQDPALVERQRWAWERLFGFPVRSPATAPPELNPLAAALLAQRPVDALHGNDGAEPGSGARLALRQVLAAAGSVLNPAHEQWRAEVRAVREDIDQLIRAALAEALPADDLDALAQGLATTDSRQANLSSLIGAAEERLDQAIDTARLRRLVTLAQGLGALADRLEQSRQGAGRASLGVVLSSGLAQGWSGAHPWNPYAQPVTVDLTGDGAALTVGLLEGQLRQATADFALVRKARLELDNPKAAAERSRSEAPHHRTDLEHLGWRDLTGQERAACPALLLAGGADALAGRGLAQLLHLLGSDLPLRILVLADLDLGLTLPRAGMDSAVAPIADSGSSLGLLALAQRQALVAQSSIAEPGHLLESCRAAFAHPGPALLHLHAPSPMRHGYPAQATLTRAGLATATRLFPLFLYDAAAEGVFGSRLSLSGNPALHGIWSPDATGAAALTPAHWALGEARFAAYFEPMPAADDPAALELTDYLTLDDAKRAERIPVITVFSGQWPEATASLAASSPSSATAESDGGATRRYRVAEPMVRVCEQQRDAWRTLQELAGLVTPFTARVQAEAEQAVAAERQAELEAQKAHYEYRLEQLRAELLAGLRHEVRERLLALAGYPPAPEQRAN